MFAFVLGGAELLVVTIAILLLAIPAMIVFLVIKRRMKNDQQMKLLQKELDELKKEHNL